MIEADFDSELTPLFCSGGEFVASVSGTVRRRPPIDLVMWVSTEAVAYLGKNADWNKTPVIPYSFIPIVSQLLSFYFFVSPPSSNSFPSPPLLSLFDARGLEKSVTLRLNVYIWHYYEWRQHKE